MQSFELNTEHLMREIYSYPFPEVRHLLAGRQLDPCFMLNTLPVDEAATLLDAYQYKPSLVLPCNPDATLNLDELHVPIIARIRQQQEPTLPGLNAYDHAYPQPGSSAAMFTLLAEWAAKGEVTSIATLEGEYEGYSAYADALNIPAKHYSELSQHPPVSGELWFVSNPSAVDGNMITADKWKEFTDDGHQIVYDAAYIGLAPDAAVDVSSPNIRAVLTSPSKMFGVFRYRQTGIAYTRQPVKALYGSKWFKDVPALLDTLSLYETFPDAGLARKYQAVQQLVSQAIADTLQTAARPSDVILLATCPDTGRSDHQRFIRAGQLRFGLTKLFEDFEAQNTMKAEAL